MTLERTLNIIFLGTPDFSVPCLRDLLADDHFNVQAVITQPDRPSGRGNKVQPTPVKQHVLDHAPPIPVYQPTSIRNDAELIQTLTNLKPDYLVTIAFGQILSQEVLDIPTLGTVNVHASLLPKYRGANPIQQAIINGDTETGLTTMLTDIGVDTGDMLLKTVVPITANTTSPTLFNELSEAGGRLLIETLLGHSNGTIKATPQDHDASTHAPKAKKEDAQLDWTQPAQQLDCKIRGQQPWPGSITHVNNEPLKIIGSRLISTDATSQPAGKLMALKDGVLHVATGCGIVGLTHVQPAGKKALPVTDWLNGLKAKGIQLEQGLSFQS